MKDNTEEISKGLKAAFRQGNFSNVTKRNLSVLQQYLEVTDAMNQREFVGLLRIMLDMSIPSQSLNAEIFILEVGKFVSRLNLQNIFKDEIRHFLPHLDQAL